MGAERIKNMEELTKVYRANSFNENFSVVGHGPYSYAIVQEMIYLYELNNKKLCKFLNKLLREYEVRSKIGFFSCKVEEIDIEKFPKEVVDIIRKMHTQCRAKKLELEEKKKNKILNELKKINIENIVEEM